MSIELQIQSVILGELTARAVQSRLATACFPPMGLVYIDHADVVQGPVNVVVANGGGVSLSVPVDVFVVRRDDVLAAPNGTPAGATSPAGRPVLQLELRLKGFVLSLECKDVDLGSLGDALGAGAAAAKVAIIAAIGVPISTDLGPALKSLGVLTPDSSRIELAGGAVAIRFDPTGDSAGHLFPGQDWGLFLDGRTVEQLALSKVPNSLKSKISNVRASWRPAGATPHVDVDYSGKFPVPDPFTAEASGTMGCDFSLTQTRSLRTTVSWSLHVDLGALVPRSVEEDIESVIAQSMNPATFGGIALGDHVFATDTSLPVFAFGRDEFQYLSVIASPAGMTVGGPIHSPAVSNPETLRLSTLPFGLPQRVQFCSILAKSGSGEPLKTITLADVSTAGYFYLGGAGKFCTFEALFPSELASYLRGPGEGQPGNSHEFWMTIPSAVAIGIDQSIRLIVRTARGVRLVDLGIPPPVEIDAHGQVTNANDSFIDNCNKIPVGPKDAHGVNWGRDGLTINPQHDLSWAELVSGPGIDVQLVTLSELEPGELVQFRSRVHAIDVTADLNGRAVVPVMLPLGEAQARATLRRVNRRDIAGHLSVQTAVFEGRAMFPAGDQNQLTPLDDGGVLLTSEFEDRVDAHEIGLLGAAASVETRENLSNGQALGHANPGSEAAGRMTAESLDGALAKRLFENGAGIPGATAVLPVPGFAGAPVAIVTVADGPNLLLDLSYEEGPRVTGTFAGPLGALDVFGDWALAADGSRASIYRVLR